VPGTASLARTGDFIGDSVLPIMDAGKVDLIDDHFKVSERVRIEPGHGHTPGHFLVSIFCPDQRAVLTGDLMHTPLQLRYPEWSTRFCVNPDMARETRLRFLEAYCERDTLVFPSHFPSPTAGRVRRDRHFFRFEFAPQAGSNVLLAEG
jgi:glyoxylase-like metal-dependent hydrolase (beta-lactamase superfamily II)